MAVARMSRDYVVCRLLNEECFCLFCVFLLRCAQCTYVSVFVVCKVCFPLAVASSIRFQCVFNNFPFFYQFSLSCNSWHALQQYHQTNVYYLNLNYAHVDREYALQFFLFLLLLHDLINQDLFLIGMHIYFIRQGDSLRLKCKRLCSICSIVVSLHQNTMVYTHKKIETIVLTRKFKKQQQQQQWRQQ